MSKHIKPCNCITCEQARYWTPCKGCPEGHPSFWKTIIESKYWAMWQKEQARIMEKHTKKNSKIYTGCYDMPEVEEIGIISPEHFQDFMKFIIKRSKSK